MPAKLPEPYERVTWRIHAEDMSLLREVFGEKAVNGAVRQLVAAYCARIRAARKA